MELHVHFLPGRVNSPGFETLSYQLVANAHILRSCLIIADTLSWGVQRQSNQYSALTRQSPKRHCGKTRSTYTVGHGTRRTLLDGQTSASRVPGN